MANFAFRKSKVDSLISKVVPAIHYNGKTYTGHRGELHSDVAEKHGLDDGDGEAGYAHPRTGKFYTRHQMHGLMAENISYMDD